MSKIYYPILFVVCLSLMAMSPPQSAKWKGTIQEVDGVTTVKNPKKPMYSEEIIFFEEDLSIGVSVGPEEYILNHILSFAADDEGNIYILDMKPFRVKVYDSQGNHLRAIGRKGQGPGEFESGSRFRISEDNKIFILSGRQYRVSVLDINGEYITGFVIDAFPPGIDIDSLNRVYYSETLPSDETLTEDYQKVASSFSLFRRDPDGKNKIKLGEFRDKISMKRAIITPSGKGIGGSISREAYTTCWLVSPQDRIYIGYNKDYKIDVYDPDWNLLFRFGRTFTPIKHPDYKPELGHPEFYPAFSEWHMFFDDEGNLWLEQYLPEDVEDHVYDVFSPDGIYLKQIWVPEVLNIVRGGKAYSILRTEEEYLVVKRFGLNVRPDVFP